MDINTATRISVGLDAIPGYRVVRLLNQGGMGGVYLAEDETLKRLVAIKVINADLTENPEFKKRFTTEALIIAGFQHPNIVTVFASGWFGVKQEKQYFVMEYIRGGALNQRMESEPLTQPNAFAIASQMADALAYSHERDVIHRDFKPNNVLLRENGTPVLSDFGIAKSVVIDGAETAIGTVVGSALYSAPEQALGEKVSNRVDIYSFGLVLHQMLVGKLPARHPIRSKEDARQLAQPLRLIAPAARDLIRRCLLAEPEQRPSAVECRDALGMLVERPAPRRFFRPLLSILAGCAVAAVAGLAAWQWGYLGRHTVPEPAKPAPVIAVPVVTSSASPPESKPAAVPAPSPSAVIVPKTVPPALKSAQSARVPSVAAKSAASTAPAQAASPPVQKTAPPAPVAAVPMAVPAGMTPLSVQRSPESAKVIVDGADIGNATVPLTAGQHLLVAVAFGYYGHMEHVDLSGSEVKAVNVALEPTTMPTAEETQRFLRLAGNARLTPAQVQSITDRTLRETLRVQRLRQSDHAPELGPLVHNVDILRRFGDSRAAVAGLLIESLRDGKISDALATPPIIAASNRGDAMASFFLALAYRGSLDSSASAITASAPQFQTYCKRIALAQTQGWALASEFRQHDHCPE
jgi:Protein kinase domain